MITEDYVSFETAKLLKEKGFDAPLWFYYDSNEELRLASWSGWEEDWNNCLINNESTPFISAPTLQMAMKWLREVHNIHVVPKFDFYAGNYTGRIYDGRRESTMEKDDYIAIVENDTYEEAADAAIKYCLENLI